MKKMSKDRKSVRTKQTSMFAMCAALFVLTSCCCNYCDNCISCEPKHCYECKPRCCPKPHWWNPECEDPTFYSL